MGNYEGLPTHEIHLDDCINIARKAKEHGVDVISGKWPNMVHAFPILSPLFPEAKQAMSDICKFAKY